MARRLKVRLVAMTDPERGGDPEALARRLPPGSWLIFRHYGFPGRSVLAARLAGICRARRITLLVAGDFALAVRLRCGLHLPQWQAARPLARVRLWRRKRGLPVSAAAHDRISLRRAGVIAVDGALLSPVFPTASHPGAPALGPRQLRLLARRSTVNVIALGGITPARLRLLAPADIAGIAAIGGLNPPRLRQPFGANSAPDELRTAQDCRRAPAPEAAGPAPRPAA